MRRWNIRRYMKAPPGNQRRSGDAGQEWPTRLGRHRPEKWIDGHADHKRGTTADRALPAGQKLDALRAVEYELPRFATSCTMWTWRRSPARVESAMCGALPTPPPPSTPSAKSC